MAIHRPKNVEPQFEIPDVKFIDDMVRASLQMNPQLRQGMSTSTYLSRMRKQAVEAMKNKAAASKPAAPAATSAKSDDERRKQTLSMFLGLKRDDLEKELAGIRERQQALANEEKAIKERCVEEIVDHLIVVCGGAHLKLAQDVLATARTLLAQLDISDSELLRRARR